MDGQESVYITKTPGEGPFVHLWLLDSSGEDIMLIKLPSLSLLFLYALASPLSAWADDVWHDLSVAVLRGSDYRVNYALSSDDSQREVITIEYAAAYTWGDLFNFIDRLASDHHQELYWEFQPRISLNPLLTNAAAFDGAVEAVLIATTLEVANFDDPDNLSPSSGSFTNALMGIGMSWRSPGFTYLHSNIYRAFNDAEADDYQLTLAWGRPFAVGEQTFLYDGFIDWSSAAADHQPSFNWTSQLKHDLGALWGKPKSLYWGIEYVYWRNKFGIAHRTSGIESTERNLNLLIKLHL